MTNGGRQCALFGYHITRPDSGHVQSAVRPYHIWYNWRQGAGDEERREGCLLMPYTHAEYTVV